MSQRSILLIEDSKLHQTFIDRALRRANYDLTLASTGIEGLSALAKKKFDLVIVDLALPDINGLSVVRTIRAMRQVENIPVIIFSSSSLPQDSQDLGELNVSAFIEKGSFKPQELIECIEEAIESVLYLKTIELLVVESPPDFEQHLCSLLPESRANLNFVEDRHGLETFLTESVPDVIVFYSCDLNERKFNWIARHYQDGLFKGIPWLVVFKNEVPPEMAAIAHNRLILPIAMPCSDLLLKKSVELLAHVHQTKLGSEEHSLELEIAYNELEKNRGALSEARSSLALRKKNLGDVLLKIGKEIRQPLTTILGYAEGLKHGSEGPAASENAVDSILNNGKYLAQVVDDILSIAAIEKGYFTVQKKSFDILPVVSELFDLTRSRSQAAGLSFSILFETEVPTEVFSDPTLIKQILRGLIDNALKFTAEGTIQLRIRYDASYNQLKLAVSDTGPGIAAERIPSLFDGISGPGDVASRVGTGSGLGLAFVKFASERLGGEVQVDSRKGDGTTFTLVIDPGEVRDTFSSELAHTIIELGAHDAEINSKELVGQVLIVDTHVENRRLLTFLLQKTSIEFTFVKESIEVFERALSGDYDMLLTDIMTAQTDGFALVRNLRKRGFGKPILTVSSCAFEDQRQRCLDVGCDAVLDKPFTLDNFYKTLSQYLNTRRPISPKPAGNGDFSMEAEDGEFDDIPERMLPDFIDLDSAVVPLVLEFIDCLRLQLAQLETARSQHAWPQIVEAALELYGSAEMYGYPVLRDTANQLNAAAEKRNIKEVSTAIRRLARVAASIEVGRQQLVGTIGTTGSSTTMKAVTAEVEEMFIPQPPDTPPRPRKSVQAANAEASKPGGESPQEKPSSSDTVAEGRSSEAGEPKAPDDPPKEVESELEFAALIERQIQEQLERQSEELSSEPDSEVTVHESDSLPNESNGRDNDALLVQELQEQLQQELDSTDEEASDFPFNFDSQFLVDPIAASTPIDSAAAAGGPGEEPEAAAAKVVSDPEVSAAKQPAAPQPASNDMEAAATALRAATRRSTPAPSEGEEASPVIIEFVHDLTSRLSLLHDAIAAANWEFVSEIVNELSGGAAIYGFNELSHKLVHLEALCGQRDRIKAHAALEEIRMAAAQLPQESVERPARGGRRTIAGMPITDLLGDEAPGEKPSRPSPTRVIESDLVKVEPSTAPLVLDFLDELKDLIRSLRNAFDQQDWQSVRDIADEVYGSAGICGYSECATLARSLKVAANVGEKDGLQSTFVEFDEICQAMFRGRDSLLS